MKKLLLASLCILLLSITQVFAQNRTVTGTVTAQEDGLPLPGVSVRVKGSTVGTQTGANGKFTLSVPGNATLVFSFIGYVATEKSAGAVVNVALVASNRQLNEVVVTALGIQRKADNLSYAQQGIKGADLTSTRQTDLNQALAGKIAGVQVKTQSAAKLGSASTIRIRGANSVSNIGNDPLIVVDGTPVDDINFINMDDVEDVQVLKGPNAAALYGQRGQNGVLIVTSKRAKANTSTVNFVSSYSIDKVGNLPHYQNEYSGGTAGAGMQTYHWKDGDPAEWKALDGKNYHTYFDDASWGPKMTGQEYIPWYAWIPGTQYSFKTAKLTPQPNNIKDFYSTGTNLQNNVSLAKAGDGYNVRVSYTNQHQTGLLPESKLDRNYLSTQLSYDISKHLSIGADINFVDQKTQGDFADTYGNANSGSFNQWFHRDLDMSKLKELQNLKTPTGRLSGWNLDDAAGISADAIYGGTAYWVNPYSYNELISAVNTQDRLYGNVNATYKFNQHFKLMGAARRNQRNTHYESKLPTILELSTEDGQSPLSFNANAGTRPINATYRVYDIKQVENNYEFLGSYNDKFGDFTVDANVGGNIRQNTYSLLDNATKGGLVVPDLFTLSNSKTTPYYFANNRTNKIVRSLYGRGSVNWNDIAVLDFSLRNDWSSALPANNNSYLYPSIGLSFILTKYINKSLPWISFAKVRGAFAEVGSDLDPYQTALLYAVGQTQFNGNITMTTPNQDIDPNIKPSLSKSFETGLDLRFLNDRLGFSGTYYTENIINSIIPVTITGASGFNSKLINAGKLNRHGIELTIDGYPIKTSNFAWNTSLNFAQNRSKVISLYPGLNNLYLGGSDYSSATGASAYAPGVWSVVGGEYGQIRGRGIQKLNGQNVIDPSTGFYAYTDNVNFGSVLPKFTGGWVNTFTYKQLSLNFTIDYSKGGKYFSLSDLWGGVSGLYDYTAGNNDRGKPVRDPVATGGGVHVKGVDKNGAPVDMYVSAIDYYVSQYGNKINETHIFDLSYIKLREVNLNYTLPVKSIGNLAKYAKSVSVGLFARNPWLIYRANKNFDPSELTGNYGESGGLPPSRSFGATLKLGF